MTRALATIRRIEEILPIEGADNIDKARVDGWWVVVKKGEFAVGDLVIYCEIDSWLPQSLAPFLCKDYKEYNGVPGARLKTVRLRGQISQGLLLPVQTSYPDGLPYGKGVVTSANGTEMFVNEGDDVTDLLGVQKWEAPISAQLAGQVKGGFPSFIRKTDQERIQNLRKNLDQWHEEDTVWEITEKLDGTSFTAFINDGEFGVCSRNLHLREDDTNTYWRVARELNLEERMRALNSNFAIQGEIVGEGIQKNRYNLKGQHLFVFAVFDINEYQYLDPAARKVVVEVFLKLQQIPMLSKLHMRRGSEYAPWSVDQLLLMAEGKSVLNAKTEREGLVFNRYGDVRESFKAISNKFLMKGGD